MERPGLLSGPVSFYQWCLVGRAGMAAGLGGETEPELPLLDAPGLVGLVAGGVVEPRYAPPFRGHSSLLWLRFDGIPEPIAYVLPWNMETAKQLQQAMHQAEADGTVVRMRRPFESDRDPNESLFYAEPQPALPPKTSLAN